MLEKGSALLKDGERIDDIGFGNFRLIQDPKEFCYGIDSVLLADFVSKRAGVSLDTVVDMGTGTGVIPLILCHKTDVKRVIGVELQESAYDKAVRNSLLNCTKDRVNFVLGDVNDVEFGWGSELKEKADAVVSNPPYFKAGGGIKSEVSAKAAARHETTATLEDFMKCAAYLLKARGELFMVHRPSRLVDICCFGRLAGLETKEIRMISPTSDEIPNIILVKLIKGGGSELKILPPIAVYDTKGNYTSDILNIYEKI